MRKALWRACAGLNPTVRYELQTKQRITVVISRLKENTTNSSIYHLGNRRFPFKGEVGESFFTIERHALTETGLRLRGTIEEDEDTTLIIVSAAYGLIGTLVTFVIGMGFAWVVVQLSVVKHFGPSTLANIGISGLGIAIFLGFHWLGLRSFFAGVRLIVEKLCLLLDAEVIKHE